MFKDKECKGCIGIENFCALPLHINKAKCPCLNCLIKGICRQGCNQYGKFMKLAIDLKIDGTFIICVYQRFKIEKEYYVSFISKHNRGGKINAK